MEKLIVDFALSTSKAWKSLDKELILKDIFYSFSQTKVSIYSFSNFPNDFGIYIFFVKPEHVFKDCESLMDVWNIDSFRKYPKVIKKRFRECEAKDGWFPFYIGKSENLGKRVNEHLSHHSQHATYGLKLKDRTEFLRNNKIEVGFWKLPEMESVPREIKQFIITNLEFILRDKMKPLVGKQ